MKTVSLLAALWRTTLTASGIAAEPTAMQQAIEADWLRQRKSQSAAASSDAATWADANGPYHSDFINKRLPVPPYGLASDKALQNAIRDAHTRRCAACQKPDEVTRLDWIDLQAPARSRFLVAPLAASAGGLGK